MTEHNEATCIAFTEIVDPDGRVWNFTARQGVTQESITEFTSELHKTSRSLEDAGWVFPKRRRPQTEKEAKARLAQRMRAKGWPIDNKDFLDKLFAKTYLGFGLGPETMRSKYGLWCQFIDTTEDIRILVGSLS